MIRSGYGSDTDDEQTESKDDAVTSCERTSRSRGITFAFLRDVAMWGSPAPVGVALVRAPPNHERQYQTHDH